jgi:ribosome assembly protein YihI (activator of Der GTPase)
MLRHDKVLASAKLIRDRIKAGEEISEEHQKYYDKALKLFKGTKKEKELTLDG